MDQGKKNDLGLQMLMSDHRQNSKDMWSYL